MRRVALTLLALTLALPSCRAKKELDEASISGSFKRESSTHLLRTVADDKYSPPPDGRLTDDQIRMYLRIREQEKGIAAVARKEMEQHARAARGHDQSLAGVMEGLHTIGSTSDFLTADIRAAKELHCNTQEYLWVKGQILAASTAAMGRKMERATTASLNSSYDQMKKQYEATTDPAAKQQLGDMVAAFDRQRQQSKPEAADSAVDYNIQLLSHHENALNAVTSEWTKYGAP